MVCGSVVRKSAVLCVVGEVVRCGVVSEGVFTLLDARAGVLSQNEKKKDR